MGSFMKRAACLLLFYFLFTLNLFALSTDDEDKDHHHHEDLTERNWARYIFRSPAPIGAEAL